MKSVKNKVEVLRVGNEEAADLVNNGGYSWATKSDFTRFQETGKVPKQA